MLCIIRITVQGTIRRLKASNELFRSDLNLDATGRITLGFFDDISRQHELAVLIFPSLTHM